MSTTNLREVVSYFAAEASGPDNPRARKAAAAWEELMAIERAAKGLTRLHLGDGVHAVRRRSNVLAETPDGGSTLEHPDVKAWSDAAALLEAIAKNAR